MGGNNKGFWQLEPAAEPADIRPRLGRALVAPWARAYIAHFCVHVRAYRFDMQAMVITSSLLVQAHGPPPGGSRRLQWVNPRRYAWGHILAEPSGDALHEQLWTAGQVASRGGCHAAAFAPPAGTGGR